ncbi:ABC transporter permease [Corynebacterium sp. NPDC060344]|uniref:ABC transporter permease n=1 Tax=Corynebacterium sp. NPDC060344 TaxID=3347101 RepID=UPI003649503A
MSTPTKNPGPARKTNAGTNNDTAANRGGYRASTAIGLVTKRELRENLVKKGSVVTLILGIVLAVGGVLLTAYLTRDDGEAAEPTRIAVVGEAPFAESLADAPEGSLPQPIETLPAVDEDAARAMIDDESADAALVPAGGDNEWSLLQNDASNTLVVTLNSALSSQLQADAISAQGGDPAAVAAAAGQGSVTSQSTQDIDFAALIVVGVGVMVMITAIMMFGGAVASSVIEEKSSRVVEIMLATIRPLHLLAGKILGAGLAGAIMMAAIVAAASATIFATGLASDFDIPWGAVATLIPFFILGYLLFAALYATAGSLVSRMEDFGAAQMPVLILSFVSIYVPAFGWSQLDGTFMQVAAWIPPASVTTAPLQYAMGNFSALQLLGSGAVLAVTCVLTLLLAAKIYPRNVLRTGTRVTWMQALKG